LAGRLKALIALVALLCPPPACAETPGKDGDVTISSGTSTVINQYAQISGSVSAGANSVTAVGLASAMPTLSVGDLIMLYQAQGATIDTSDTRNFGAVTAYNSAGRYEFQTVASVSGNTVTFASYAGNCSGLRYSYSGSTGGQIVRVPQYRNFTVNTGAVVVASNWNGTTGGIIALTASVGVTVNGSLSVIGRGFRGGAVDNAESTYNISTYRTSVLADAAEKGESIAGYQSQIAGGNYLGRGAPANGGGGGNAHNAGGGGGANGDNGNSWAGQGVPDTSNGSWVSA